jgi:hypothetical protein
LLHTQASAAVVCVDGAGVKIPNDPAG